MPKLLVFAPCEKTIISQDENNPTLIAILSSLTLQGDEVSLNEAIGTGDAPLALVPIRWAVFSMWLKEPSDAANEFVQTIDIESPAGSVVISNRSTFAFTPDAHTHRINLIYPGFPIRERGWYKIKLSLNGNLVAEYPLELKLTTADTTH